MDHKLLINYIVQVATKPPAKELLDGLIHVAGIADRIYLIPQTPSGISVEVTVRGLFEDRRHVRRNSIRPGIAIVAGVVAHEVAEISYESSVRHHGQKRLAEHLVGQRQRFGGVAGVDLRMQSHVHQRERDLAAITRPLRSELCFLQLGQNVGGDLLGRIAIIARERVQHLLVPDPVLEHLGGGFDEVARNARAGEAGIPGAGHDRVHGVAKFVEQGLDVHMGKQRRLVFRRRREVADQRDRGALVLATGQQLAVDDTELRKVIVFALAREHVEVEQPERLTGLGVGDGVKLQTANPFVGRFDALEFEPEDVLVDAEHAVEDLLIREIDPQLLRIHVILLLLQLVAQVTPIPHAHLRIRIAGFLDLDLAVLA